MIALAAPRARRATAIGIATAPRIWPLYRAGDRCPVCTGAAWHVGRHTAECARCSTPLPLAPVEDDRG